MYLLSGMTLLDLAAREHNPTKAWFAGQRVIQCRLSAVAIGMAHLTIDQKLQGIKASQYRMAVDHLVADVSVRSSSEPISVDVNVMHQWVQIEQETLEVAIPGVGLRRLGTHMRMVIATANYHRLTLADPVAHYHAQLVELGFAVQSI
jgi:hypothetical protein